MNQKWAAFQQKPLEEQIAFFLDLYNSGLLVQSELRAGLYYLLNLEEHIALKCAAGFNGVTKEHIDKLITQH